MNTNENVRNFIQMLTNKCTNETGVLDSIFQEQM